MSQEDKARAPAADMTPKVAPAGQVSQVQDAPRSAAGPATP